MDKEIVLVMSDDKSITIYVNNVLKYTILEKSREISAQDIYDLINYKIGDVLSVSTINKKNIDVPVLDFFKELLDDICTRIQELDLEEDDIDQNSQS